MRVAIATDMEGAAGIDHVHQVLRDYPEAFEVGRHHLIADINACIRGLRRGGATEIKVVEQHGWGIYRAFESHELEGAPEVLRGPASPLAGWAQAVVLLGYHAMAGTPDGFLSHTIRPFTALSLGGEAVGEITVTAAPFGAAGVPVIYLTGDDATLRECDYFLPWTLKTSVKRASDRITLVSMMSREAATEAIERGAADSLGRMSACRPFALKTPIDVGVHFRSKEMADAAMLMPLSRRLDERTIGFTAPTLADAMRFYTASWMVAAPAWERTLSQRVEALPEVRKLRREWTAEWIRAWLDEPMAFTPNPRAAGR
jgi:D-amino peptidase